MKSFLVTFILFSSTLTTVSFGQDMARGGELYKQCIACHGDKGDGNPAQKAPRLSGQHDWYILKQLQDMKAGVTRKNPVLVTASQATRLIGSCANAASNTASAT